MEMENGIGTEYRHAHNVYSAHTEVALPQKDVLCIDPSIGSGLVLSLACEPHIYTVLSDKPAVLNEKLKRYYPSSFRPHGANAGTGVFIVTPGGRLVWTTLRGSTKDIAFSLEELINAYLSPHFLCLMEKPIPQNPMLNQTVGFLAGFLNGLYNTDPIYLLVNWRKNERRIFNLFLRRYGVSYPNPTEHEISATLLYYALFEKAVTGEEGEQKNEAVGETVCVYKQRSLSEVVVYRNGEIVNPEEAEEVKRLLQSPVDATKLRGKGVTLC